MYLTVVNLVSFLSSKSYIDDREVIDGTLSVTDVGRRNRGFAVHRHERRGFFIKQARATVPNATGSLAREADCYALSSEFAELSHVMPTLVAYLPASAILITELIDSARSPVDFSREHMTAIAGQLGKSVGAIHTIGSEIVRRSVYGERLQRGVPGILKHEKTSNASLDTVFEGAPAVERAIRKTPGMIESLIEIGRTWRCDALIHGDLRWGNIVVPADESFDALKIIDWEMAGIGDAAWDTGSFFQALLATWIASMPASVDIIEDITNAGFALTTMREAADAFWASYARARAFSVAMASSERERALRFSAACLIVCAMEQCPKAIVLDIAVARMLQLAAGILNDTKQTASDLFGR